MGKLLIVSLHTRGGCYHYSNEIISRISLEKDVYLNGITQEKHNIKNYSILKAYGYNRLEKYISLFLFLLKIYFYGVVNKYNALLLMGFTAWDPFIAKVFKWTGKSVFYVVHDGKVHLGETGDFTQKRTVSAMQDSKYLIFLSDYVRNLVKENFGIQKDSYITPHGLINYGKLPLKPKSKKEKPILLFLGRLSKYKGVDLFIDALKDIPDVFSKVIIAGKTMFGYEINTDNPKIEIIDKWLLEDEMADLLNECDILVFPYLEATQSGIATLAINYLVPSIVNNVGGLYEQFPNETALFQNPEITELRESIIELSTNNDLYKSISDKLLFLRESYSWDNITLGLENFISTNIER